MWYLIILILLCFAGYLYWGEIPPKQTAAQNTSSGLVSYSRQSLDSLRANGIISLQEAQVKQKLEVNGSLKAERATIGTLHVNGYANLTECTIQNESQINGFLNASKTTFKGPLQAASQGIQLEDCTLQSIVIKNAGWILGTQTVELTGYSIVKGSITFESGSGKVIVSPDSIVKGPIIGGSKSSSRT